MWPFVYLAALTAIVAAARRRGVRLELIVLPALALLAGALLVPATTEAGMRLIGAAWLWIGIASLIILVSHRGRQIGMTWQCPDCTLFNDSRTLICLCGYAHPEAPEAAKHIEVKRKSRPAFDSWPAKAEAGLIHFSLVAFTLALAACLLYALPDIVTEISEIASESP